MRETGFIAPPPPPAAIVFAEAILWAGDIVAEPMPIRMFSIDRCFRREQEEDATHLRTYHSASCIVAGEDVTIEEGEIRCLVGENGSGKSTFVKIASGVYHHTAGTVRIAAERSRNGISRLTRDFGSGSSRRIARVTTPSVPSEPTIRSLGL